MSRLIAVPFAALLMTTAAFAQSTPTTNPQLLTAVPSGSVTVTDWYKQSVYDPAGNKIGDVADVLVSDDGRVTAVMVGVGGFLGIGEKDVALSFNAIKRTVNDNKTTLTLETSKDALKAAQGFKYDRNTTTWMPETSK
jgi:sporulation protein YlmC with PRC-barrel domain